MLTALIIGLLFILLGAAFCLFGYRLFVFLLPVWGFVAGFLMGAQGVATVLGEGFLATLTGWIVGILLGIFLAAISFFIYSFGVYLLAATFGLGLGAVLMLALGIESGLVITIVVLAGATIMIILVAFLDVKKWLIVALTALGGAAAVVAGILVAIGKLSLTNIQAGSNPITSVFEDSLLWTILWVAFGVVGIVYQARNTKDFFIDDGATFYRQLLANSTPPADEPTPQENQLGDVDDGAVSENLESAPGEMGDDELQEVDGEEPKSEIAVDDEAEIEQDGEDTADKAEAGKHEDGE